MKSLPSRTFIVRTGLIMLGALIARVFLIGSYLPTRDDYLVPVTADFYTATGQPYPVMPFHPALRNLMTSLSMEVFGRGAVGVKFFSLLLGTLLVAAVALLVRRASRDERAGMIAALLVAVDILLIDYSRQAIQEVHVAFFAVAGAWLVAEALAQDETRAWRWMLPLAGLSFGLGISSKLYALMPLLGSIAVLSWTSVRRRHWDEVVLLVGSLVLLPAAVYLLVCVPWFGRGYGLVEWVGYQYATLQATVAHTRPPVGFFANSRPALWFIVPFYAFADYAPTIRGAQLAVGLGNPLVWLAVLPAAVYSLVSTELRRRTWLLQLFFWAAYLPLALSPRPVWMLSAVSVAPFALAVLATVLADLQRGRAKTLVAGYLIAVLLTSALLYPLALGRALEVSYLKPIVEGLHLEQVIPDEKAQ